MGYTQHDQNSRSAEINRIEAKLQCLTIARMGTNTPATIRHTTSRSGLCILSLSYEGGSSMFSFGQAKPFATKKPSAMLGFFVDNTLSVQHGTNPLLNDF